MSHILEQYFSGEDDNTSDYIMEGMLKSMIHSSKLQLRTFGLCGQKQYHVDRHWALNTLVSKGKTTELDGAL